MDQASTVREKIDIVSLITEYIPLKKMGRNFTSTCPFHSENTPSFVVSPERQIWHCFGCGKGGDAFTFLMEYENLEFIEALRILAKKTGVVLKTSETSFASSKKELIYSLNKLALEYYNYVLTKHPVGNKALGYLLKNRGLSEKLIKTFEIGFAPSHGDDLSKYLINKKKHRDTDLIDAGLSFRKGNRILDFFRGRIIFPLIDHRGNIVGFSGRNITDKDFGPKYINTRDTLTYHKGSMFFGLNQAKEEIKKEGFSIVMEGEFDVISAFAEGIKNAVALKGTALTEAQALLLSRFAPKTALCLDQDLAGAEAVKRSIPVLEKRGLLITVVIPKEKDPDDAIKKNPVEFKKAIKNQIDVYDYLIEKSLLENDKATAIGKKKITDEMLPLISSIQNEIVKEHYLKKLSLVIDTSYDALIRQLSKKEEFVENSVISKIQKQNRREMLEEYLLSLIIQGSNPRDLVYKTKDVLLEYKFQISSIGKIFSDLNVFFGKSEKFTIDSFSKNLAKELSPVFDKCFLLPLPKFENLSKYQEELLRVSRELRIISLKERIKEIGKNLKNGTENKEKIEELQKEISYIASQFASS